MFYVNNILFSAYFKADEVKVHNSLRALRENEDNEPSILLTVRHRYQEV